MRGSRHWLSILASLVFLPLGVGACGGSGPAAPAASASSGDEYEDDEEDEDGAEDDAQVAPPGPRADDDGAERSACRGAACPFDVELWLEQHGIDEPLVQPTGLPADTQAYDGGCRAVAFGEGGPEGLVCRSGNELGGGWVQWYETLLVPQGTFMRLVWTGPVEVVRAGEAGRELPSLALERAFEERAAGFTLAAAACDGILATLDATPLDTLGDVRPTRLRRSFAAVCAARGRYALERGAYRRAR